MEVLEQSWFGNTPREWLTAAIIAAVTWAALWAVEWVAARRFAKFAAQSRFTFDDIVVAILRATRSWFTLLVAAWAASLVLELPGDFALEATEPSLRERLETFVKLALIFQIGLWGVAGIRTGVKGYSERRAESDPSAITTMSAMGLFGIIALWVLLGLAALDALGFNVTTLLAGLGIGGIAVAFALQGVLGDLFASLSIVLDKPFVIGDFIVVGTEAGTVEYIGLKTTRVRSLSGEQLIFGNSDLLASRVRNMKRMSERRVPFTVGVTYQTPREKLIEIPQRLRAIIEGTPDVRFDRAHFATFAASSLDFEIVYYVKNPDYIVYRDRHQAISLAIHEYFETAGIEFAYPTQVVYVAGEASAPTAGDPA